MSQTTQKAPERPRKKSSEMHGPFSRQNLKATLLKGYLPLLIATLVMVLPLLWMIISSFKLRGEIISMPVQWLPHSAYGGNYTIAADKVPFARDFLNSIIVTFFGAGIKVVLAILTAYALVFIRFPFKRVVFVLILVTLMVPPQIAMVPNYVFIVGLGGMNTYWGIILPGLASAFGTFLLRQQFMTFPQSVTEAAEIDGASHWKRLWSIVVPISAPAIATVTLVSIVYEWNDYLWPLVIIDDPHMMTLPVGLTLLQNVEAGSSQWGVMMAGTVLVIVPILIVFAMLQRYIVSGLTQGAVKD
ncbi:carbohydrate ABC transporter permease [Spelaeicoccus albus]|uniref:sn-glycerol 3-phosphate transport system permease protein n=2 Tax=Spelaeicoccus albus TaxID=1280376 RepID=A0A7Z0CZN1_9MICO|nr:sn-glycerol 3-phosphate transport system permease protein [Spelaeicoccus albus]